MTQHAAARKRPVAIALAVQLLLLTPGCTGDNESGREGAGREGLGAGDMEGGGTAPIQGGSTHSEPPGSGLGATPTQAFAAQRQQLVQELAAAGITDKRLLEVLGNVPRHEFVPAESRHRSYENSALPIDENQTISQPYIVALMTQLLELTGNEKVLEIGTGSGYQAAVLGEMAREGEVYTVEIRPTLQKRAKEKLEELKARGSLHYKKLEAIVGDGSRGYPDAAPYDAILVTAAPPETPEALKKQLKIGGRMVVPIGNYSHQELRCLRKKSDGTWEERTIAPTQFAPLEPR